MADVRASKKRGCDWKFVAKNVRDAVFAASPEYQWDALSTERTAMGIIVVRGSYWHDAADQSRMSMRSIRNGGIRIRGRISPRWKVRSAAWNTR